MLARCSLVPLAFASVALARPEIGPESFSGSETRISFDSLTGGTSVSFGEVVENQYAPLGVVFVNPNYQNRANAWPSSATPGHSLPNSMFVDQDGSITVGVPPLQVNFAVPVNRVGMFLSGSLSTTYTLRVYSATGLLETLTRPGITTPSTITPPSTYIYLGIERSERIVRCEVSARRPFPGPGQSNFFVDDVQFEPWPRPCYANCDGSTIAPVLTANDFQCFINAFVNQQPYANCDGSTFPPAFTANDFQCYINRFAGGCT